MFGMSVFQSVLERLKAEEENSEAEDPAENEPVRGVRGLGQGFVSTLDQKGLNDQALVHRAYFDNAGEDMLAPPQPIAEPVMPDHLARTRPQEIAADLAFTDDETPASLTAKRRAFATRNHPDRHPVLFRQNATTRMKIANMLIDEALRRINILQRLA
ncbi:hypothetical protein [Pararhizobium antarcticum]|uniref:J domain-containing protein n=1 Tax=Pararhizobium antarcticum TaxID=1798805 RepID=A0A657LS96_9HYPH|nr:hypothetical protein [Pararhizobium antarcticum]OJF94376.1 hypothetical protein AX761_18810 [Rhizobium sp. 58]OJF96903.1 hypothetical protein AX760_03365 [Pararhizobium antarcticum]